MTAEQPGSGAPAAGERTMASGPSPEPAQLLATALAVVRPAAEQVQRLRERAVTEVETKSTATDVVTAADRAVERQLVTALRRLRPDDAVLGEEYGESDGGADGTADGTGGGAGRPVVRWLLDPIDGTVNYLYGIPWYAVSVAAEVSGQVVAGVVHNPATGQEWSAAAGHGAWLGGRRLHGSRETRLDRALLATGFAYDPARRLHQATAVAELITDVRDIRRLGAAALDLCLVAEGVIDCYFEKGLQPWDYAAGALIASEAGVTVAGMSGAPAGTGMTIAAPPALFGALHERLVAVDAAGGP